jgi:hypothetical protein
MRAQLLVPALAVGALAAPMHMHVEPMDMHVEPMEMHDEHMDTRGLKEARAVDAAQEPQANASLLHPEAVPAFSWPLCQQHLACTFDQIQTASLTDKQNYVGYLSTNFAKNYNAVTQFNSFQGLQQFLASKSVVPGSYGSYLLTGNIEGIQNGLALAQGLTTSNAGNPR